MALTAKNRSWSSVEVDCKILLEEVDSWACILRKQLCMYMHVVTCFIIIMHRCECAKAYSSQFIYLCVFLYISLKVAKSQLSAGGHSTGTAQQYIISNLLVLDFGIKALFTADGVIYSPLMHVPDLSAAHNRSPCNLIHTTDTAADSHTVQ